MRIGSLNNTRSMDNVVSLCPPQCRMALSAAQRSTQAHDDPAEHGRMPQSVGLVRHHQIGQDRLGLTRACVAAWDN